jgi:hypothetical protein
MKGKQNRTAGQSKQGMEESLKITKQKSSIIQ